VSTVWKETSLSVKTIRFPVRVGFHARLKQRVHQYFADNRLPKTGDWRLFLKTGIIVLWFGLFYILYVFFATSLLMSLLTVVALAQGFILIGFNMMHDPAISTIVRQTCDEFAIPYVCYPTVWAAIVGHYRLLKTLRSRSMSLPTFVGGTVL
jgi:hypothetical protein